MFETTRWPEALVSSVQLPSDWWDRPGVPVGAGEHRGDPPVGFADARQREPLHGADRRQPLAFRNEDHLAALVGCAVRGGDADRIDEAQAHVGGPVERVVVARRAAADVEQDRAGGIDPDRRVPGAATPS